MIELPDDELDKLFRKSSEELDPTYEPDDWNDLRKRLDEQDGRTPAGWWRKWWPLGVLALLIPAGIMLYSWYADKKDTTAANLTPLAKGRVSNVEEQGAPGSETAKTTGEGKENIARVPAEAGSNVDEIRESEISGKGTGATAAEKRNVNANVKVAAEAPESKRRIGSNAVSGGRTRRAGGRTNSEDGLNAGVKVTGKSISRSEPSAAGATGSQTLPRSQSKTGGVYLEPNRSKVGGGDGAFSNTKTSEISSDGPTAAPAVSQVAQADRMPIAVNALTSRNVRWSAMEMPTVAATEMDALEPLKEVAPPRKPAFPADDQPLYAVRFGYSPDLSTVGLKDFSKPGTAVSLLAEYAVFPGVFVQSGVVWSRKTYYGDANAYELPKIAHYYPPEMTGVDGTCKILEWPVGVRYDFAHGQRSRWFASGGLSSYHMNSEKYKYYFVDENDPAIKYRGWQGKTGWYWFSHANVSAGYEYRVSRKLSLLAEPSIRMPLKRIGYGKVNLITTGLWLSVRYTPVFK